MNITSNFCWANNWNAKSLQNVGPDVISVRQGNVIKFLDLKTMATTFFKCDTPTLGLDISVYAGHDRFPFFAIAEVVLCPNIFIYKYPEMTKYTAMERISVIGFVDMRFSDFDLLIAMSGYPDYTIFVFNFRTGVELGKIVTNIPCKNYDLIMQSSQFPVIVVYSEWDLKTVCFDMMPLNKGVILNKIAEIELGKKFQQSTSSFMCFADDYHYFVVNDYGEFFVSSFSASIFRIKWSPPSVENISSTDAAKPHMLMFYRGGFVIANQTTLYFIKKKSGTYILEWTFKNITVNIDKYVCNENNQMYAQNPFGEIYNITVDNNNAVDFKIISKTGEPINTFLFLRGNKDEAVLLFKTSGILEMVNIRNGANISTLILNDANAVTTHGQFAYVIVGTTKGTIYLISYEKIATPNILFELQTELTAILRMQFLDTTIIANDDNNTYNIIQVDYKPLNMTHLAMIDYEQLTKNVHIQDWYLIEGQRILFFIARETSEMAINYATELWIVHWIIKTKQLHITKYNLPERYVNFCIIPPVSGRLSYIEFSATIKNSCILDTYQITEVTNMLHRVSSMRTTHFGPVLGISCSKNMLTWSFDGIIMHFRSHKRSKTPFMISRFVKLFSTPNIVYKAEDAFNFKYLVTTFSGGLIRVMRLPPLQDNIRENTAMLIEENDMQLEAEDNLILPLTLTASTINQVVEHSKADLRKRDRVLQMINKFSIKVTELIDYDISVTGKTEGIFKKFCFNYTWLDNVTKAAKKLCAVERKSLELAINDHARIRDWIMQRVTNEAININYKVRAIFATANFENYAMLRKTDMTEFDKYRFYDLEDFKKHSIEDDDSSAELPPPLPAQQQQALPGVTSQMRESLKGFIASRKSIKRLKRYVVEGDSIYEHIMSPLFALQDKNLVTCNQIYNDNVKFRYYLNEPLKQEFNKLFHEAQQLKIETINNVLNTNTVLNKIYDNMNIMLRLLNMEQFEPPKLSVPELAKDEVIKSIMEVDDSELKAINRRKPKVIDTGGKRGRLLLWSVEFWAHALIVMMDGVVEKLWEEEIKKDIPVPDFVIKKDPHEYSLEDQKLFRIYEEAVRQLQEDRKKYLGILHENERNTLDLKTKQIIKLNRRVTELMHLKLKYDYAMKQNCIRVLNLKTINSKHLEWRNHIKQFRNNIDKLTKYIDIYTKMIEYTETANAEMKARMEQLQTRDRAVDRQFRSHYLNSVQHATNEMMKLYRKRPKIPPKVFNSALVCFEAANRLQGKTQTQQRMSFPLPIEVHEFFALIDEFDLPKHCPQVVDIKNWEPFVKLRRLKTISELKMKGVSYYLLEINNGLTARQRDLNGLKDSKTLMQKGLADSTQRYIEEMRNVTLQLTITLAQVEVFIDGNIANLSGSVLMHVDDINNVNKMIKEAGEKKLKAMHRVAKFRRQVIYKEWEHKVVKANIEYLKYMLDAIERCKVSMEFLQILRNWDKVKRERGKLMAEGAIERVIEQKIAAFRKHIERVNEKIDNAKQKVLELKRENYRINEAIDLTKVDVALYNINRDYMMEDKRRREQSERMARIKEHRNLLEAVRTDYARKMELNTILELLRLRTYPTLGPPTPQCPEKFY